MSVEENKSVVRRWVDEVVNGGNLDVADEILSADFESSMGNRQEFKQVIAYLHTTFPDFHQTIDELIGEFLRAHPVRFLPNQASAGSLFGIVEEILGRFRPQRADVQLEDLVSAVTGSADSDEQRGTVGQRLLIQIQFRQNANLWRGKLNRLPVVDTEGKLAGLVSLDDILDLLSEEFAEIGRLVRSESPEVLANR